MPAFTLLYPASTDDTVNDPPWFFPSVFRGDWDVDPSGAAAFSALTGYIAGTDNNFVQIQEFAFPTEQRVGMYRWASQALAAQTISGTIDMIMGAWESDAGANFSTKLYIYVTAGETDTVRGVLLDFEDTDEWPLTAAGIALSAPQTLTTLPVQEGDRLIIEMGVFANNIVGTNFQGKLYAGGRHGQGALALGGTDVTVKRGTFSFSNAIDILEPASVPGDIIIGNEQLYVYDQTTGELKRIILQSSGATSAPDPSNGIQLSDGSFVFPTEATTSELIFYDSRFNVTNIVSAVGTRARSLTRDGQDNIYVGFRGDTNLNPTAPTYYPRKFDADGTLLASYAVSIGTAGPSSIDLKSDQRTLVYVDRGRTIKAYDVLADAQLPDIVTLPSETGPTYNVAARAYGIRNLQDGGYLVADLIDIKRLDSAGNIVQRYSEPNVEDWQSVSVGVGWSSFVSATIGAPDSSAITNPGNPNVQGATGPGTPLVIKWDIVTGRKIFELLQDVDPDTGGSQRGFSTDGGPLAGAFNPPPNDGDPEVIPIRRLRRSPHVFADNKMIFLSRLEPYLRTGIGTTSGQGIDALVMLRVSKDGGNTWGTERLLSAGQLGRYVQRLQSYLFGRARDWVFEITVTDPVTPWVLVDLFADIEKQEGA